MVMAMWLPSHPGVDHVSDHDREIVRDMLFCPFRLCGLWSFSPLMLTTAEV